MADCQFKIYINSNWTTFKVSMDIQVKGENYDTKKIIIFFDNNFQIKLKSHPNNHLNASAKE